MTGKVVEVAAAILLRPGADGDGSQEYLLARRPSGKVYAGYWEFPGGKVEPGESMHQALLRELHEELGIDIERAWPWLSRCFTYPHANVRLKFFRVVAWRGDVVPSEHDGIVWVKIGSDPRVAPVLPANGPILKALALPPEYVLTNAVANGAEAELQNLRTALRAGVRLIQVDERMLPPARRGQFARQVMALAGEYPEVRVLVADDEQLAQAIGAHGVHLSSPRLMQLDRRPPFDYVAASCHDAIELDRAAALGLDFALLGPVPGIGWDRFAQLVEPLPLPVFAFGEASPPTLDAAREYGAHGIVRQVGGKLNGG